MTSNMLFYPHLLAAVFDRPWAVHPDTMGVIADLVGNRAVGLRLEAGDIQERLAAAAAANGPRKGGHRQATVQVIPMYGVITPRAGMMANFSGGTSVESLQKHVRAALADPEVNALVLDIDSPGGDVAGVPELASELFAARSQKPIYAVANTNAFSAAYWLGSQASEFYVSPSGSVGSIGVVAVHEDHTERLAKEGVKPTVVTSSRYKAERSRASALTKEARDDIQQEVDAYHAMFIDAVAAGRGVDAQSVRKDFGEGRTFVAKRAEAKGMVDGVATLEQVVQRAAEQALAGAGSEVEATYTFTLQDEIDITNHSSVIPNTTYVVNSGTNVLPSISFDWAPVAEPFAVRLQRVLAEVEAVAAHAQERADMRAEEGRTLSKETRERLEAIREALGVLEVATREPSPEPLTSVAGLEAILKQYELEALSNG